MATRTGWWRCFPTPLPIGKRPSTIPWEDDTQYGSTGGRTRRTPRKTSSLRRRSGRSRTIPRLPAGKPALPERPPERGSSSTERSGLCFQVIRAPFTARSSKSGGTEGNPEACPAPGDRSGFPACLRSANKTHRVYPRATERDFNPHTDRRSDNEHRGATQDGGRSPTGPRGHRRHTRDDPAGPLLPELDRLGGRWCSDRGARTPARARGPGHSGHAGLDAPLRRSRDMVESTIAGGLAERGA